MVVELLDLAKVQKNRETYTVEDTSPEEEVGIMYSDVEILKKQPEQTQRPARKRVLHCLPPPP